MVRQQLPQPHGFEGLGRVGIHVHPRRLAVAERPDLGKGHFNGHLGRLRPAALAREDNDLVARVVDGVDLKRPVVKDGAPVCDEGPRSLTSVIDLLLGPAVEVRHVPHKVGRDILRVEFAGGREPLVTVLDDLHVLPRHRPPSIPGMARRSQGQGSQDVSDSGRGFGLWTIRVPVA
jgi:hypothetical protein